MTPNKALFILYLTHAVSYLIVTAALEILHRSYGRPYLRYWAFSWWSLCCHRAVGSLLLYPLSFLASYRLDQREKITRVAAPLLVVHGTGDRIAPFELGRRLYDLAPGPKRLVSIEGGGLTASPSARGRRP